MQDIFKICKMQDIFGTILYLLNVKKVMSDLHERIKKTTPKTKRLYHHAACFLTRWITYISSEMSSQCIPITYTYLKTTSCF